MDAVTAPALELEDVSFGFGEGGAPVLDGLTLSVARGAFFAVVGPSGVGKSTLLRVIAGLVRPGRGRVRLAASPERGRRPTAMVFQDARLLPWRRVAGNVELGLERLGLTRAERQRRAAGALELVGLANEARRWPHRLSGGQRQRVGLARALAVRPDLLLVDEPFGALDAFTRDRLQDELLRLWADTGATVIFVTHDLAEAIYLADRVVVLGGTPARVVRDMAVELPRPRPRGAAALDAQVGALRRALDESFVEGGGI